jgi:hypothetical protein
MSMTFISRGAVYTTACIRNCSPIRSGLGVAQHPPGRDELADAHGDGSVDEDMVDAGGGLAGWSYLARSATVSGPKRVRSARAPGTGDDNVLDPVKGGRRRRLGALLAEQPVQRLAAAGIGTRRQSCAVHPEPAAGSTLDKPSPHASTIGTAAPTPADVGDDDGDVLPKCRDRP